MFCVLVKSNGTLNNYQSVAVPNPPITEWCKPTKCRTQARSEASQILEDDKVSWRKSNLSITCSSLWRKPSYTRNVHVHLTAEEVSSKSSNSSWWKMYKWRTRMKESHQEIGVLQGTVCGPIQFLCTTKWRRIWRTSFKISSMVTQMMQMLDCHLIKSKAVSGVWRQCFEQINSFEMWLWPLPK